MVFLNVSVFICLQVVVITMTVISMEAYEIKRDVFFNADVTSHRKSRPRNFFLEQPFIDKTLGLQTSATPVKDRTVSQRALREMSLKDRAIYPSDFPISRHQAIKQNSFMIASSFRDKPLFKDAILKNRELREARAVLRDNPFEGQSLTSEKIFEGQASTDGSQAPFKEQLFTTETSFKNLFRGQSSSAEQASLQKQATFLESPSISNSINFYRDDYIKPIDSYECYKDTPTLFDGKSLMYTKYGELMDVVQFRGHVTGTFCVTLHQRMNFSLIMGYTLIFFFFRLSNLTCSNCFAGNPILNFLLKHKIVC